MARMLRAPRGRVIIAAVDPVTETESGIHLARGIEQPMGYVLSVGEPEEVRLPSGATLLRKTELKVGDLVVWHRDLGDHVEMKDWEGSGVPVSSVPISQVMGWVDGSVGWRLVVEPVERSEP